MSTVRRLFACLLILGVSLAGCQNVQNNTPCPDGGTCKAGDAGGAACKDGACPSCKEAGACSDAGACREAGVCSDAGACREAGVCSDAAPCPARDCGVCNDMKAADVGAPDLFVNQDSGTPSIPAENVLYVAGATSDSLKAYTVNTDGTGKKAVTTLPATFDIEPITDLASPAEPAHVSRHRPMVMAHVSGYWSYLHLPNKHGHLYHYITASPAGRGFFIVKPNGAAAILDFIAGTSSSANTYSSSVGARPDGTMFAAAYATGSSTMAGIKLIRTDGKTFSGNKAGICDISPTSPRMYFPKVHSFRFSKSQFWFIAYDPIDGSLYLYRAPLDCSAKAAPVALPKVGGLTPTFLHDQVSLSEDSSRLLVMGGGDASKTDLLIIDTAAGAGSNLTGTPSYHEKAGYQLMSTSASGSRAGISPNNSHAAWVHNNAGVDELYMRPLNKSSAAVHITGGANFASAVDEVYSVQWINDDTLFFVAGTSQKTSDMYTYKVSTGAVAALTTRGGTKPPFAGYSTSVLGHGYPDGGWLSPGGKYLYFLEAQGSAYAPEQYNLRGFERATGKLMDITKGLYITPGAINLEAAPAGPNVYFFAASPMSPGRMDLFVFDQDKATPALNLSAFPKTSTYQSIIDIFPGQDGTRAAFASGSAYGRSLYVAEAKSPPVLHTVHAFSPSAGAHSYIGEQKLFTTDGKALVFTLDTTGGYKFDLRIKSLYGGTVTVLDSTKGYTHVMAVYK